MLKTASTPFHKFWTLRSENGYMISYSVIILLLCGYLHIYLWWIWRPWQQHWRFCCTSKSIRRCYQCCDVVGKMVCYSKISLLYRSCCEVRRPADIEWLGMQVFEFISVWHLFLGIWRRERYFLSEGQLKRWSDDELSEWHFGQSEVRINYNLLVSNSQLNDHYFLASRWSYCGWLCNGVDFNARNFLFVSLSLSSF